jgi:hypothetical protein
VNFFQPSFKLASKTRVGAKVVKRYHAPQTPCARLLAAAATPAAVKARLQQVAEALAPLRLLEEVRAMQQHLAALAAGERPPLAPTRDVELEGFLKSLATAWQDGEVRPTHRATPTRPRDWRTRADPFAEVWPQVRGWLEAEPDRTAKELIERLQQAHPAQFPAGQLRTLQRRIHEWRSTEARRLVLAGAEPLGPAPTEPTA